MPLPLIEKLTVRLVNEPVLKVPENKIKAEDELPFGKLRKLNGNIPTPLTKIWVWSLSVNIPKILPESFPKNRYSTAHLAAQPVSG